MSLEKRDGFIWMDGEFVPWAEAKVHCLTHTMHYGSGVFEGVRAYETPKGPAIFRLKEHTERLFQSAKLMGMEIPYSHDEINAAHLEILRKNKLKSAYLRPLVYLGAESLGVSPKNHAVRIFIAAWEWGEYHGADAAAKGLKVRTSSYVRNNINSVSCKAKACGNYVNSMLSIQEAEKTGYNEGLLLDQYGFVAEGSGENIFIVKKGVLSTPTTATILEGITRESIITIANDLGYKVKERNIPRDEVYTADEAFFTGTAVEISFINSLDNKPIGNGQRGPVAEKIQKFYSEVVRGHHEKYHNWLSFLNT